MVATGADCWPLWYTDRQCPEIAEHHTKTMAQRFQRPYWVGMLLLFASLACSLVPEGTITDDQRLVRDDRPALLLLTPQQGDVYALGTAIDFHVIAQDTVGISRIEVAIDQPDEPLILTYVVDPPATEVEAVLPWLPPTSQLYLVTVLAFREDGDPADPADDIPSNEILLSVDVLPFEGIEPPPPPSDLQLTEIPAEQVETAPLPTLPSDLAVYSAVVTSVDSVPVRQGPGVQYPTVQTLNSGEVLSVVGRSEDSLWFVIQVPGGYGWIIGDALTVGGSVNDLAVVAAPPIEE